MGCVIQRNSVGKYCEFDSGHSHKCFGHRCDCRAGRSDGQSAEEILPGRNDPWLGGSRQKPNRLANEYIEKPSAARAVPET
jgi:hypothetical protein